MNRTLNRGAGLLMPVSSLPSPYGIGTFGTCAYEFVDTLKAARQKYWQVLPLGPTSYGDSPYQSLSAFAGNPYFIDLDTLVAEKLLLEKEIADCYWGEDPTQVSYDAVFYYRYPLLKKAFERSLHQETREYEEFLKKHSHWLFDYALYTACKFHFDNKEWGSWEEDIRFRKPEAVKRYEELLKNEIEFFSFLQFKFYQQWEKLKAYANDNGIQIIGDIPIYVALDSADVWVYPELFQLDEKTLLPTRVAGVPPDAFCDEGQLWGNPLYKWDVMEEQDFSWWKSRIRAVACLYDLVRIDHFIGVVQYYSIPYGAVDGKLGEWKKGPGKKLTDAIDEAAGETKIIAEDLGVFSPEVKALLAQTGYPGMKVIEFGFSGDRSNEHLPHNYSPNSVVYGGTHDNETLAGYFDKDKCQWWELQYIMDYMGVSDHRQLIDKIFHTAYASVSSIAIFQVQDVLKLDNKARMNTPSTVGDNWRWRMKPGQISQEEIKRLSWLVDIFGR